MLLHLRKDEQGFTLIELLVVILIMGTLATIALPTFLGQQRKGQDASAKSDARNLVTHVESCFADSQDYRSCQNADLGAGTGLKLGTGPGQVSAVADSATTFHVTAYSKSGNEFTMERDAGGFTRTCTAGGSGGCTPDEVW